MNLLLRVLLFAIWSFVVAQLLEFVKSYASGNDRLPLWVLLFWPGYYFGYSSNCQLRTYLLGLQQRQNKLNLTLI